MKLSNIADRVIISLTMPELITSVANPLIKRIRSLAQKKFREQERTFFVEGIQPVWSAIEHHAQIQVIIVAPELLTSESAREMIDSARAKNIHVVNVNRAVFESFAERENPSGLGALVEMREANLDQLTITTKSIFIALHQVGNPGNLGTIIRTADAVGASAVILIGETTDEYHPHAVKASMGALFNVPVVHVARAEDLFAWCKLRGVNVITTSAHAAQDYAPVKYPLPALFLFGSEGEGLSKEILARGNLAVKIPMEGTATSLNLAVAVGVILYEVKRQVA